MKINSSLFLCCSLFHATAFSEQVLEAQAVNIAPKIDGLIDAEVWKDAIPITTFDKIANIELTLKAVYKDDVIYMLVQYPDEQANYAHKTLYWDKAKKAYLTGNDREDTFVFKWNMEPYPVDLSISAKKAYQADLWFWKAHRTDHAGYADDKIQFYSNRPDSKAQKVLNKRGSYFYLVRKGDSGTAAYQSQVITQYRGDNIDNFKQLIPTGSRADVRAKGFWKQGVWTIEFSRPFYTDHIDDVQFMLGGRYQFGVSRHEIAGRPPNPKLEQPLYGSGEINENLFLDIKAPEL